MKLRVMEEKPNMTKTQIEEMINKEIETYHKNGSLTYAVRSDRLRKESEFEKGELDTITVTEGGNDISGY